MPSESTKVPKRIVAEENFPRLDAFLAAQLAGTSRARAQKFIAAGEVTVDGKPGRASQKVKSGSVVEVLASDDAAPVGLEPEDIPLDILYEDDDFLAVNKPAGLVVHPAHGNWTGTLVNALLAHSKGKLGRGAFSVGGELRPGIVHRIDKETSGVLLVAKTDAAFACLAPQFKEHTISRKYLGICWGRPPQEGSFDGPIGRDPKHRKRMAVTKDGKRALTRYRVLERLGPASLIEAELFTGRTHQIRVHFANAGYPLVGDESYSHSGRSARKAAIAGLAALRKVAPEAADSVEALTKGGKRQMLHARMLAFDPFAGKPRREIQADPPADFAGLLDLLRSSAVEPKAR